MKNITKFNEHGNKKGFTIGYLKRIIEDLDDETPVSYTANTSHIKQFIKTRGLLIYEG